MTLFGRRVIVTTLDPVPRGLRASPGVLAMNRDEIDAIERSDEETFGRIISIVQAEDMVDALLAMRTPRPRRRALGPSTRLFMLGTLTPGRGERRAPRHAGAPS
jgi:hypothetical protein